MTSLNGTVRSSHDRKLRYRHMLVDLSTVEELVDNNERVRRTANTIQETRHMLGEGSVEECARHPGEVYLDSRVLHEASHLAVKCSEAFSGNVNVYDKHELSLHIKVNPEFWTFMFPNEVPSMGYLYGTFAPTLPEQRPKAPRRQLLRQKAAALKAPENVDKLDKVEEGSQMVSRVNRFITSKYKKTQKPLSYFHTVIDPHSFSATIENIYYVSFLVQDCKISVQLDKTYGLPFITPVSGSQREQTDVTKQLIVSMDQKKWKDLIEAFDITEPMMVLPR